MTDFNADMREDLDDYFMRDRENTLKFINFGRELLGEPKMTVEEFNDATRP